MLSSLYFQICSFFYIILLVIVYFSKKRLNNFENKIYISLALTNICGLVLEFISHYTISHMQQMPLLNSIVTKSYLVYLFTWILLFSIYVFVISFKDKLKGKEQLKKHIMCTTWFIYIVVSIILYILPLNYYVKGEFMYSYGAGANLLYIIVPICMIISLIFMFTNIKKIGKTKYLPLMLFFVLGTVVMLIQKENPQLLLITSTETFITFLMYFTIENPDMKLINELNIAKDSAEKANNAKSEFLSSMSHEIRTPLNAIVGFSQALRDENISQEAREQVEDIIMASDTLLEIVNGILDISKIEANKLEIIDTEYSFNKIASELNILVKTRLGEKPIEYKVSIDPTIPPVLYGDQIRMKQIILNLLTNAVKYTNEGYIDFKVSCLRKNDVCRLIISVEDTGLGIKKEKIDKLFTKFERLDVERNTTVEGTGLGLAITKKLVELMNGQIVVQSVFGKGSKFTVAVNQRIVVGKTALEEETIAQESVEVLNDDKKTVLIVDDNKLNIKVATVLLKNYDVVIDSCLSGFECIDKINSGKKYDLILMDDMMPKMSGVETLPKLQEIENFHTPVVVLTANAISGMKEKYISVGFNDYLAKPIEKPELEKIMKKFVSK